MPKCRFEELESMASAYASDLKTAQDSIIEKHCLTYGPRAGANFSPPVKVKKRTSK